MTDRDVLFIYRIQQAEDTLSDATRMLNDNYSPRSIINRAYYAMFYSLLALYLKSGLDVNTSKHAGIISNPGSRRGGYGASEGPSFNEFFEKLKEKQWDIYNGKYKPSKRSIRNAKKELDKLEKNEI